MSDPRTNLKRTITLVPLIGIEVGQSIGAGIFALTGLALARTGPSLPLAFVAAAVLVSLAMAVLAMVGSGHPVSGGTYYYGSRYFSPVASFTGVWAYLLGAVLGMFPLFALTGARFLQWVFPALPLLPTALALLLFFYLTNLFGVKLAMWVQAAMVGVLFVALFVFVGAGLPRVDLASFRPLFTGGVGGFAVASALLTFTVLGANAAVELGDEIVDPSRTIPKSFLVSIPVVTVIYVAIAVVVAGAGPWTGKADEALTGIAAILPLPPAVPVLPLRRRVPRRGHHAERHLPLGHQVAAADRRRRPAAARPGRGQPALRHAPLAAHGDRRALVRLAVPGGRPGRDLRDLRVARRHHHLHSRHDRGPAPAPATSPTSTSAPRCACAARCTGSPRSAGSCSACS